MKRNKIYNIDENNINSNSNGRTVKNDIQNQKIKSTDILQFLIYFFIVISLGCYLFFNGFLLMRFELPQRSKCNESPLNYQNHQDQNKSFIERPEGCWIDASFKKSVIVIIDALRFDFVHKQNPKETKGYSAYIHNHLTFVDRLLQEDSEHSLLFRFIADSPTVTMQRIKGITTGSLPTFIDVGSNFGGDAIVEDSLIHQLSFTDGSTEADHIHQSVNTLDQRLGFVSNETMFRKKVIFIGDDTWVSLFPNHFYSQYPFPSFNVKDIHTVDNGVIENILPIITKPESSGNWDVIISHMLGVDHVGHTYGPYHPEMIKKLDQMNTFLQNIIDNLDNDTLFILMGDHGMTSDGNHGGASNEETESAIFLYSKGKSINRRNLPTIFQTPGSPNGSVKNVSQIDLVSTLSLLLGVPIPFGNLGSIIPELFYSTQDTSVQGWTRLMQSIRINTWQIKRYLDSYSKVSKELGSSSLKYFNDLLDRVEKDYSSLGSLSTESDYIRVYQGYLKYHQEVVELCRKIWATFDTVTMKFGMALLISCALVIVVFIVQLVRYQKTLFKFPLNSVIISSILGVAVGFLLNLFVFPELLLNSVIVSSSVASLLAILYRVVRNSGKNNNNNINHIEIIRKQWGVFQYVLSLLPIVCMVIHGVSFHSNSFIESQRSVVYYFTITIELLLIVYLLKLKFNGSHFLPKTWRSWKSYIAIIIFSLFQIKKLLNTSSTPNTTNTVDDQPEIEKQQQTSQQEMFAEALENLPFYLFYLVLVFFNLSLLIKNIGFKNQGLEFGLLVTRLKVICGFILTLLSVYWLSLPRLIHHTSWIIKGILPWLMYINVIFGSVATFFGKHRDNGDDGNVNESDQSSNYIEKIKYTFFKVSEVFMYQYLLIMLVSNHSHAESVFYLFLAIQSQTVLFSRVSTTGGQSDSNYLITLMYPILWGFLTILNFFSTDHDYSFNKIQFESAFVGFESHSIIRGGILVLYNTFSSQILFSLSLPLMLIYTRYLNPTIHHHTLTSDITSSTTSSFVKLWKSWRLNNELLIGYLSYLLFFLFNTIMVCFSVYNLRRHLMVWRVFAPKYIFETVQLLLIMLFLILSLCILKYFKLK
ncbi:hypothetical protein DLAC_11548 [Tieghemostelium lacteum]|uniref:Uncharacterized protein n=1 Tax=Tieghemostelium lacteum TaxID=361077 RepID=A0A152A234_TIELA|nr:hypothetical protein DLAC_11548 [Tieghemostelium lacteum]|eukprot:KYR00177.1 hypothetical protein DLAC_11548 [Tieghemostelium lacteum]